MNAAVNNDEKEAAIKAALDRLVEIRWLGHYAVKGERFHLGWNQIGADAVFELKKWNELFCLHQAHDAPHTLYVIMSGGSVIGTEGGLTQSFCRDMIDYGFGEWHGEGMSWTPYGHEFCNRYMKLIGRFGDTRPRMLWALFVIVRNYG